MKQKDKIDIFVRDPLRECMSYTVCKDTLRLPRFYGRTEIF